MKSNLNKIKFILCASLILSLTSKAQNVPINFEAGGNGAAWTWTPFENSSNPAIQIVANPSATGINSSTTCAKMTALVAGQPWAGFESLHPGSLPPGASNLGAFTLSNSNAVVKMMVYKSVISDVGIKFANATNGSTGEIKVANTLINQWEELTFNFAPKIAEPTSTNIDQIIFFPDFQTRTSDNICYIDNISFNAVTVPTAPLLAAPAPTALSTNVISLFSNTYTNVPMSTWATGWSSAAYSTLQLPNTTGGPVTNDTKLYTNLNFVGAEASATIDATPMNTFNVDVWTPNMTEFRVKLVDYGANGVWEPPGPGSDNVEHELSFTPTLSGWNTYSIPLANFTVLTTKAHIAQLIFSGNPSGSGTVYIDNVYFSFVAPIVPALAAPTPNTAPNVISLFSNAYTNVPVDTWRTGWSNATLTDLMLPNTSGGAVINNTKRYSALDFVGIETTGPNLINATNMTYFNINVWTPNATTFRIKLVDFGANGAWEPPGPGSDNVEHELVLTPALSGWNTYTIPLSSFTGLTTRAHMAQYILSALPSGLADVYIDNVFFSTNAPLAIEINSFTAKLENTNALLNWKTENEIEVKNYEVEKSIDGTSFTTVNTINAKNETSNEYSTTDNVITNSGTIYYRIKENKLNGTSTYSDIKSLNLNNVQATIYPNPSVSNINVSNAPFGKAVIFNLLGNVVSVVDIKNKNQQVNISQLPIGFYTLRLQSGTILPFTKQ
jgi:hypothetical protein